MMFAERLKQLRQKRGLTQKELADIVSLSSSSIAMYESGKRLPDLDSLVRLADYFSVTTDYLVGRTDDTSGADTIRQILEDLRLLKNRILAMQDQLVAARAECWAVDVDARKREELQMRVHMLEHDLANARGEFGALEHELREAMTEVERIQRATVLTEPEGPSPRQRLIYFLRGKQLTDQDVEAVEDLLEARRLRREREGREKDQP